MPTLRVPAELRELTGGLRTVAAPGHTVAEVIDALDGRFPGLRERLVDGTALRPGLTVLLRGDERAAGLGAPVADADEIFILEQISGGSDSPP